MPDEDLFIDIWDNLATRSTTKREDLHGIFVVMLGLSAQEILSRKSPEERMQAVLRAQDNLPVSMLYDSYPDNTPLSEDYRFVPHFPTGTLSTRFGNMTWTSDGSGLQFELPDTASVAFTTDPDMKFGGENFFNLVVTIPQISESIHILVRLMPSGDSLPGRIQAGERLCLVMHKVLEKITGPGACFTLSGRDGSGDLSLVFVCPLVYGWAAITLPDEAEASISSIYPTYAAKPEHPNAKCVLKCGKQIPSCICKVSKTSELMGQIH